MSFHPSLNIKKKHSNRKKILIGVFLFIMAFLIGRPITHITKGVLHSLAATGMDIANQGGEALNIKTFLPQSKKMLRKRILTLEKELEDARINLFISETAMSENKELREMLGNTPTDSIRFVAGILAKPNRSLYGTMILDIGKKDVSIGDLVYAFGNIQIGTIISVEQKTATVRMFGAPGNEIYVTTKEGMELKIVGRGNGNFLFEVPSDMEILEGADLFLPGTETVLVAQVKKVIFDPRDPAKQVFASSPVNVESIRFVQIEKQ